MRNGEVLKGRIKDIADKSRENSMARLQNGHRITRQLHQMLSREVIASGYDGTTQTVRRMERVLEALIRKAEEGHIPAIEVLLERYAGRIPQMDLAEGQGAQVQFVILGAPQSQDSATWLEAARRQALEHQASADVVDVEPAQVSATSPEPVEPD